MSSQATGFFGELYLRSTLPFLSEEVTAREVACLARLLGGGPGAGPPGPILDLGCGHGRHAAPLSRALRRAVLGLERDPLSLSLRREPFPAVRGDFHRLPFRTASAGGAFAWYSTLLILEDDAAHLRLLQEVARVLRPGAPLCLHTVPYERLAAAPAARFERRLPDGSVVEEESAFDPRTGVERGHRRLHLPDGRVLSGTYTIRYYPLPQLEDLLWRSGFKLTAAHGGLDGEPCTPGAVDLIVGAMRRDA